MQIHSLILIRLLIAPVEMGKGGHKQAHPTADKQNAT
jgi:hypothetical protein